MNILLIDFMNLFFRNYAASPLMEINTGKPIGGLVGTIISLSNVIEQFKPEKVILCYDGKKGKDKRRRIYEEYKKGRKEVRLNRKYEDLTSEEVRENKYEQLDELNELLNYLPLYKIEVETCEADDLIAYICECLFKGDDKKIVSMDRDFLQLVKNDVMVFSPIKKILYDKRKLEEEYGIKNSANFIIYRALLGDKSDNVKNIESIGPKTIEKLFPLLYEDKEYLLEDIFTFSSSQINIPENKLSDKYMKILENRELLEMNYKITQLKSSMLNVLDSERILSELEKDRNFNVVMFRLFLERHQIETSMDTERFINNLMYLKHVK